MPRFSDNFLDEIRSRVPLSEVVGTRVQWHKKSRPAAGDYWAPCPFHAEKSPSFHVVDKKRFYHCFGCGVSGDHFKFLREIDGMEFHRAVEIVASMAGVSLPDREWSADEKAEVAKRKKAREENEAKRRRQEEADQKRRIKSVKDIWQETARYEGSLGKAYLNWRCPGLGDFDDENIRFHPALEHPDVPGKHGAVIARVLDVDGRGVGIWRIYVAPGGAGKLKVPDESNAKLGLGPTSGGAVRLGGNASTIGLCEGIETARALKLLGVAYPVWPALSTSGIIAFKIPAGVDRIVCYPDPDGSKLKTKTRHDGTTFIAQPPGYEAIRRFRENNPGRDIVTAEAAHGDDYLEILQKLKGVPIR